MTLTIPIAPEIEKQLHRLAAAAGEDPAAYVARVIARDLSRPCLDDLLRPVREQFAASGLSESQLNDLASRAVKHARNDAA